jgi:hypothetical protein
LEEKYHEIKVGYLFWPSLKFMPFFDSLPLFFVNKKVLRLIFEISNFLNFVSFIGNTGKPKHNTTDSNRNITPFSQVHEILKHSQKVVCN